MPGKIIPDQFEDFSRILDLKTEGLKAIIDSLSSEVLLQHILNLIKKGDTRYKKAVTNLKNGKLADISGKMFQNHYYHWQKLVMAATFEQIAGIARDCEQGRYKNDLLQVIAYRLRTYLNEKNLRKFSRNNVNLSVLYEEKADMMIERLLETKLGEWDPEQGSFMGFFVKNRNSPGDNLNRIKKVTMVDIGVIIDKENSSIPVNTLKYHTDSGAIRKYTIYLICNYSISKPHKEICFMGTQSGLLVKDNPGQKEDGKSGYINLIFFNDFKDLSLYSIWKYFKEAILTLTDFHESDISGFSKRLEISCGNTYRGSEYKHILNDCGDRESGSIILDSFFINCYNGKEVVEEKVRATISEWNYTLKQRIKEKIYRFSKS